MLGLSGLTQTAIAALPGTSSSDTHYELGAELIGRQEQPWHPRSQFNPGIQGPNVNAPDRKTDIILRQEQPFHPGSRFDAGIQGPNVAPPPQIRTNILLRQEQPFHPPPFLRGSNHFYKLPNIDYCFVRQEQPWHPRSFIWDPNEFDDIDPLLGQIYTRQEQPFQALWPRPPMHSGQPTSHETVFGYLIG